MRLQLMSSVQGIPISDSQRGSKHPLSVEVVDGSGNQISNFGSTIVSQNTTLLDSNTTLFTPGGSYNGPWFLVMGLYSALNVTSFINVPGFGGASRYAAVQVQFSSDGVNFNGDFVTINVGLTDGNPARVAMPVGDNYARLSISEQGGFNWFAAGGSARTVLSAIPVGSGSFVRAVGTTVVDGDGTGTIGAGVTIAGWDYSSTTRNLVKVDSSGNQYVLGTGVSSSVLTSERTGLTGTLTNTSVATSSTTLAASSTSRRGVVVHNDSSQVLFLKYGTSASSTSYTFLVQPGEHWWMPMPLYTGAVTGIAGAATGTWRITTW